MQKRCVVTGIGVVSSVGIGKQQWWRSLVEGRSGVSPITYFDTSELPVHVGGEVKNFKPSLYVDENRLPVTARYTQFAIAAAKMAAEDGGMRPNQHSNSRPSLILGTTSPPVDSVETQLKSVLQEKTHLHVSAHALTAICPHAPTAEVANALGFFESTSTISTACTSGFNAIGAGLRDIQTGRKDIVLAGATESTLAFFTFLAFIASGLLAKNSDMPPEAIMRPFDRKRHGGVLSEGSTFVVLEELEHARMRGAHIYGEIAGFASREKHRGSMRTLPIKQGMVHAMREALADARIRPEDVDFVSANGTSGVISDKMETLALKEVFGKHAYRLPISSIKSMTGIPNSTAGPMQLAAALMSFETDIIPPTINYECPDPDCDLDYVPNVARINRVNVALLNNHALDDSNAVLVAKRYSDSDNHVV